MSKGNTFENDLLKLIFWGTAIANIADNAASGPLSDLYVALHTADPTDAGAQNSNEISYTGYSRVAVARSAAGWDITDNEVTPVDPIDFGQMTAGAGGVATHWSVGVAVSGATKILYSGAISPNINVVNGVTPRLDEGTMITED